MGSTASTPGTAFAAAGIEGAQAAAEHRAALDAGHAPCRSSARRCRSGPAVDLVRRVQPRAPGCRSASTRPAPSGTRRAAAAARRRRSASSPKPSRSVAIGWMTSPRSTGSPPHPPPSAARRPPPAGAGHGAGLAQLGPGVAHRGAAAGQLLADQPVGVLGAAGAKRTVIWSRPTPSSSAISIGSAVITPCPISERATMKAMLPSGSMRIQAFGANASAPAPALSAARRRHPRATATAGAGRAAARRRRPGASGNRGGRSGITGHVRWPPRSGWRPGGWPCAPGCRCRSGTAPDPWPR
jgi:hypothetical protein